MIDELTFVRGAVSSSDTVLPVLSHFCIYKGRIQGGNGRVTIDAPCAELDFEVVIPAERFLKAVDACKGEPQLRFTDKGKLVIERKPFRAHLPTQKFDTFPRAIPSSGDRYKLGGGLIDTLKLLRPFIATDAERAWASTMYFDPEGNVYSTTNAMLGMTQCEAFVGGLGEVTLPVFMVDELLRIYSESSRYPDLVSSDESGITFFYGEAWVKAAHIVAEWPTETAKKWLASTSDMMQEIPKGLMSSIEQLLPFCPDPKFPVIHFKSGMITTAEGESSASIEGFNLGVASMHADNLRPMIACSDRMGITDRAAIFEGEDFKGVMSLLRI